MKAESDVLSCLQNVVSTVQYTPHIIADLEKLPSRVCRAAQQDSKSLSSVRCLNNLAGWKMQWKTWFQCNSIELLRRRSCLSSADYHQRLCHSSCILIKFIIQMCLSYVKGGLHSWSKVSKRWSGSACVQWLEVHFLLPALPLVLCRKGCGGKKWKRRPNNNFQPWFLSLEVMQCLATMSWYLCCCLEIAGFLHALG